MGKTTQSESGQAHLPPGASLSIAGGLLRLSVPELQGEMKMAFIMYIVAISELLEGKRNEEEFDQFVKETREIASDTLASVVIPDPAIENTGPATLSLNTQPGKPTNVTVYVPSARGHCGEDVENEEPAIYVHAKGGKLHIKDFESSSKFIFAYPHTNYPTGLHLQQSGKSIVIYA